MNLQERKNYWTIPEKKEFKDLFPFQELFELLGGRVLSFYWIDLANDFL